MNTSNSSSRIVRRVLISFDVLVAIAPGREVSHHNLVCARLLTFPPQCHARKVKQYLYCLHQ